MIRIVRGPLLMVCLVFVPAIAPAVAQSISSTPTCSAERAKLEFAYLATSFDQWQEHSQIAIPEGIAIELERQLCEAVLELAAERGVAPTSLETAAKAALHEHLDRTVDVARQGRTVRAALRSQAGVSGISRPTPKEYGVLSVSYQQKIDSLVVGGQKLRPYPRILIKLGDAHVAGVLSAKTVCSGRVTVTAESESKFVC